MPASSVPATADLYTRNPPSTANTLGLFAGEWSSRLPASLGALGPGSVRLFEDERIDWLIEQTGGMTGMRVLELGPLEGGHTYMLQQAGAASVLAIESNSHAYLKCLIIKELLGLTRAHFRYGDFMRWFDTAGPEAAAGAFDLAVASGVLYHMVDPVGLLTRLVERVDRVFLWTHYYDADVIASEPGLRVKFPGDTEEVVVDGATYTLHRQEYMAASGMAGFCGGSAPHSLWMRRQDILDVLGCAGLTDQRIAHESRDHVNGPCFSVFAQRPGIGFSQRGTSTAPALPVLTTADVEAAIGHLQADTATLRARLADVEAHLHHLTTTRWWRTRQHLARLARTVRRP